MAQTTTNLLQATNNLLLDLGEREVTGFSNPVSKKAVIAIQESVNEVKYAHDWSWLTEQTPLFSWSDITKTARVPNMQRLKSIFYVGDFKNLELQPLTYREIVQINSFYLTPRFYAIKQENEVYFSPFPTSIEERSKLLAYIIKSIEPPNNALSVFDCTEEVLSNLILKRAKAIFYQRFLNDSNSYQITNNEFLEQLNLMRQKDSLVTSGSTNMYKRTIL